MHGFFPTACLCDTVNMSGTADFNVLFCSSEINAVVVFCQAEVFERWGNFFVHHKFLANAIKCAFGNKFKFA